MLILADRKLTLKKKKREKKKSKNLNLTIDLRKIYNTKFTAVPLVIGALGTVSESIEKKL